jgi:uncharacterized protein
VIVTSGGIGGNHDLVRKNWPKRMGRVPKQLLKGGARARRRPDDRTDRMWHYTEGITNYDPIWPLHGSPSVTPAWRWGARVTPA